MSNLSDFFDAITDKDKGAADLAGGFIGLVADISGVIGFLQWFQNLGQPADAAVQAALNKLQAAIDAGRQATDTGVAALGLQQNYQAVDSVVDPARGVFGTLPTIDPQDETSVSNAITTCFTALIALRDDVGSKWTVPFAEGATSYSDDWSGNLFPPHTNVMFNYTYVLPQFIRTIGYFMAVIAALKPSALADYTGDLSLCADRLQNVYDTIMSTLVGIRTPQVGAVAYISFETNFEQLKTDWFNSKSGGQPVDGPDPNLWPFGAVEEYSGASNSDSYWQFLPFRIDPGVSGSTVITDNFIRMVELRIENRKKSLYGRMGLPVVLQTINQLRSITGQPRSASQPFERWSIRNALSILGISLNGLGLFHSIDAFLKPIPPYSGGALFPLAVGGTYPPSAVPKSFRSLFAPV
jgi:hypothetical protein